jgi:hypothetical protein
MCFFFTRPVMSASFSCSVKKKKKKKNQNKIFNLIQKFLYNYFFFEKKKIIFLRETEHIYIKCMRFKKKKKIEKKKKFFFFYIYDMRMSKFM